MKKKISVLCLSLILVMAACGKESSNLTPLYVAEKLQLDTQMEITNALISEIEAGYTIDSPFIAVNPYEIAPLSAIIAFDTEKKVEVKVTVKGHYDEDSLTACFPEEKHHVMPIYGLYSGETTELVLELSDGTTKTVFIEADKVDETFAKVDVVTLNPTDYDYSKLTLVYQMAGIKGYDSKGDLRLYTTLPAFPVLELSNGNYAGFTAESVGQLAYKGLVEYDFTGRIYNRYELPAGVHHEIRELPSGNLLVGYSHDDNSVINCRVVEIERKTGNIVWDLDLCDILDPTDGSGLSQTENNWFHNNGFWYDEATDSLLLSGRQVDSVVCVDKSTKELKWVLGTNEGWTKTDPSLFFTPIDKTGFEWQFAQHNVSILPDTDDNPATMDILLFDNGCYRVKKTNTEDIVSGDDVYSRAVVFNINTDTMTVSQKWEYGKERGASWYSSYISGAEYDPLENTFWICSGGIKYDVDKETYDVQVVNSGLSNSTKEYTFVDGVKDGRLIYELKLNENSYRCARVNPYKGVNGYLDLSVMGNLFVIE